MISRLAALWQNHRAAVLVVCTLAAAALAGAFIWPITDLIAAHDVGQIAGPHRATQLQTAREAVRTQLLTLGAGLFAAGALVYTARNFTLSRRNIELIGQGQVTDRYTKAIEQLGSDKLDVRIGGIYALERVAHDSPRDHPTVMEVLTAFIREHSPVRRSPAKPAGDTPPGRTTRPDVQAAVRVIGRRVAGYDRPIIDLTRTDLTDADLTDANLNGAYLNEADLTGADLTGAHLIEADLADANLPFANLTGADFTGAHLFNANLTRAHLTETDFTRADLTLAYWHRDAVVPEGWQLDTDSGRLKRADTHSGGAATE